MSAMMHAADDELSNKFADFSAGWLKSAAEDRLTFKANKIKNKKRLSSVKNEAPRANRNISSIVSKIRDEGAAFNNVETRLNQQTRQESEPASTEKTCSEVTPEITQEFADACHDDVLNLSSNANKVASASSAKQHRRSRKQATSSFSAVCDQPLEIDINDAASVKAEPEQKNNRKKQISVIAIIAFIVIAVFAYMSYQFKLQSDEMRQTLLTYKQTMNEEKSNQDEPRVEAVSILKQNVASPNVNTIEPVDKQDSVIVEKKINSEIQPLVNDTVTVKPLPILKEAIKTAKVKTYMAADKPLMFTVNLASFSEKEKAYGQLAMFKAVGVSPIIEQAVVANKTIYRLCVEGFSSREEASWFISRLNKKYAINAWVRRS